MAVGAQPANETPPREPLGGTELGSPDEALLARDALREARMQRYAPRATDRIERRLGARDVAPGQEDSVAHELAQSRRAASRSNSNALSLTQESDAGFDEQLMGAVTSVSGDDSERENVNSKQAESRIAQRMNRLSRRRRAMYKNLKAASSIGSNVKRYKQLRNILKIAKIGTGVTFVGLIVTLLIANIEWLYSSVFNKEYPFGFWEKVITALADLLVLMLVIAIIVILVYIAGVAGEFLSYLGL